MTRSQRPRRRGRTRRERARPEAQEAAALAASLRGAYLADDPAAVARVLGPDVRVVVDDGGAGATPLPVAVGVASGMALLRGVLGEPALLRLEVRPMNGRSGLVASRDGAVVAVVVPTGAAGAVGHLWVVADPRKLGHWR